MTQTELITGRVTAVRPNGLQIEGGMWASYTKYGAGANVEHPSVGEHVTIQVNEKGFVQNLIRNGDTPARKSVYQEVENESTDRQTLIVRQSCLRNAVTFYSLANHDLESCGKASEHVLALAARFENWVNRKDER